MRAVAIALALAALPVAAQQRPIAPAYLKSGFELSGPDVRAMQLDDFSNPAMLWVERGAKLWAQQGGKSDQSCAGCHGDARASMKGVAARYPRIDRASGKLLTLESRILQSRTERQGAAPWRRESEELLAITAFVAHQSRGLPITAGDDERSRPFVDEGRQLFAQRQGQLNLSCAACHTDHRGERLAGNPIPQGHPTGYPLYRLEWQSTGSLQRRLRNCMTGVRAESYEYGSPEFANLELYLMWRARGLPLETPAVRP